MRADAEFRGVPRAGGASLCAARHAAKRRVPRMGAGRAVGVAAPVRVRSVNALKVKR